MLHRIRRQILEIELPREAGAVALQQQFSRLFQEKVLPELDEVFGKLAPADRHVRIERLEIELGDLSEARWERDFVEQCVRQISQRVAESALETGLPDAPPSETVSPEENAWVIVLHFLEHGALPWFAKGVSLKDLEPVLEKMADERPAVFEKQLLMLLRSKPEALRRLVWQFSPKTVEKVLETALRLPENWLVQVFRVREGQTARPIAVEEKMRLFEVLMLPESKNLLQHPPEPAMLAQIFSEQNIETKTLPHPAAEPEKTVASKALPRPKPAVEKPSTPTTPPAEVLREGVFVDNAGLVLFAPYLPAFFEALGLVFEKNFENENAQTRAIHLLYFLATGQEQPEEPFLVLPKILCGLSPETPVPQELGLTEFEKTESSNLLEAVVRNWPALKNTGTDGLCQAFVRRNGQVSWQENRQSWLLQVERLAQDILLERLPWGYSVVKLPWMENILTTEW